MASDLEAKVARLVKAMDETGWGGYVLRRRADEERAHALAVLGIASSISHEPGAAEWTLNLSRAGQALRKRLAEIAEREWDAETSHQEATHPQGGPDRGEARREGGA